MEPSIINPAVTLLMKHLVIGQPQKAPNFSAFHLSPYGSTITEKDRNKLNYRSGPNHRIGPAIAVFFCFSCFNFKSIECLSNDIICLLNNVLSRSKGVCIVLSLGRIFVFLFMVRKISEKNCPFQNSVVKQLNSSFQDKRSFS